MYLTASSFDIAGADHSGTSSNLGSWVHSTHEPVLPTAMRLDASILAARIAGVANEGARDRDALVRDLLQILLDAGFERARYYETAADRVNHSHRLVLVGSTEDTHIGLQMEDATSSRRLAGASSTAAPCNESQLKVLSKGQMPRWFYDLDLPGRSWIDIPVRALNDDVGLLAADWKGPVEWLQSSDVEVLTLLGQLAGGMLALSPGRRIQRAVSELPKPDQSTERSILEAALPIIASTFNVAACALFEYRWTTNSLVKIREIVYGSVPSRSESLSEVYSVGEFLTGQAWLDTETRYIPDFGDYSRKHQHAIEQRSLKRHSGLVGEIRTVLYSKIGGREATYLVRLMNRADDPRLPFLAEEAQLRTFVDELNTDIAAARARQRLSNLQKLALKVVTHPETPRDVASAMAAYLLQEGVKVFGLFSNADGGHRFSFAEIFINGKPAQRHLEQLSWQEDDIYERISRWASGEPTTSKAYFEFDEKGRGPITEMLRSHGRGVLAFIVKTGHTFGTLVVPLNRDPLKGNSRTQVSSEIVRLIAAYSQVSVTAIGTRSSYLTAAGARRVLGFIGHELSTPLAILGDIGVEAIARAQTALDSIPSSPETAALYRQLEDHYTRIGAQRHQVAQLLAVAPLVAQESQGLLQVHFERTSLQQVLVRAKEQALRNAKGQRVVIALSDSCARLGFVVCDSALMEQVITNLLNNAIKYSLPRYRNEPIQIRVTAQPQEGMSILQIENWGLGIASEDVNEIFEPFVRGNVEDERKAIRGMGLGLFLSRRIMSAHHGEIYCLSSRPTLNDPARLARMEGYLTTFEVRLPHGLSPGTHTVKLDTR